MRLFHYTRIGNLIRIIADNQIKLATLYVERGERAVVWCSLRQDWEPTATPGIPGQSRLPSFEEFSKIETPARIEVAPDAASVNWWTWRKTSGVRSKIVRALEDQALRVNAKTSDWRMSFEPIGRKDWLAMELFVDGEWKDAGPFLVKLFEYSKPVRE